MKKIIIIGAGVAGLTAGIYARRAGYETIIYEKNDTTGGSCSGWFRNGYGIDNCIHWLTGTHDGTEQNKVWKEVGVLSDDTKLIRRDAFYSSEYQGVRATLWRDLTRTRQEMIEISPEDTDEINIFVDCVIFVHEVLSTGMTPKDVLKTFSESDFSMSHFEFAKYFIRYLSLDSEQWAEKFKSPVLKSLILDFMAKEYESYWMIMAYSFFAFENGDIPEGGSIYVAKQLTKTYLEAGGILHTKTPVDRILINKQKVTFHTVENALQKSKNVKTVKKVIMRHVDGVQLAGGTIEYADYVICTCDMNYTFNHLLKKKYTPRSLKDIYDNKKECITYSSFQVAFSVDGLLEEVDDTLGIECRPFEIAYESYHRITLKNYRSYGDYIAPAGHTVIQVSLPQYENDFRYWKKLYQNKAQYNTKKRNFAEIIMHRIEERFPEYEGKLHYLDAWTPYTYARRNNDYKGAYMRFLTTPFNRNAFLPMDIKGLTNVYLAGHWLRYPGGLPTASTTGKNVIDLIIKNDRGSL